MEDASILLSIAEVCVGLAGFGGIAAGIGYRANSDRWADHDRVRFIWLILFSLAAIFGCFIPFAIHHLNLSQPWQISSIILMVVPILALRTQAGIILRGIPEGYSKNSIVIMVGLHILIFLILLLIAFDYSPEREFGLYLVSVLLLLLKASFLFLRMLATAYLSGNTSLTMADSKQAMSDNEQGL